MATLWFVYRSTGVTRQWSSVWW